MSRSLDGETTPDEARRFYAMQVRSMDRFHRRLLTMQSLIARTPEQVLAAIGRICSRPSLTWRVMDKYWGDSGWFVGQPS